MRRNDPVFRKLLHTNVLQWKFIKFQSCFKIVSRLENLAQMREKLIFFLTNFCQTTNMY